MSVPNTTVRLINKVALEKAAKLESKKVGYHVTVTDLVNRAAKELLERLGYAK